MQAVKKRDTPPELAVRSALHRKGLRFRVDREPIKGLRRRADVVFGPTRVAVFVDGCFWHGCPLHGTWPIANADWWRKKIEANVRRDRETNELLVEAGWEVVRVWAHEDAERVACRIAEVVARRRGEVEERRGVGA